MKITRKKKAEEGRGEEQQQKQKLEHYVKLFSKRNAKQKLSIKPETSWISNINSKMYASKKHSAELGQSTQFSGHLKLMDQPLVMCNIPPSNHLHSCCMYPIHSNTFFPPLTTSNTNLDTNSPVLSQWSSGLVATMSTFQLCCKVKNWRKMIESRFSSVRKPFFHFQVQCSQCLGDRRQ